jgi:Lon protease-like protein
MNVLAQGGERFRILSLDYRLPYLVGQIERLPMPDLDPPDVGNLLPIVKDYIEMLSQIMPDDMDTAAINFPDDPMINLNLSASVLQLPDREKQDLLAVQDSHELYLQLLRLFKRELSVFNHLRDVPKKQIRRLLRLN